MSRLASIFNQYYPPTPTFTDKDVSAGSQVGKVFLVTGANSGIGLVLVKQLYKTGATIYLAGRSPAKLEGAIHDVQSASPPPTTPATLKPLVVDFMDLTTVKPAAAAFAAQETRLDIVWSNAGAGHPPGTVTKQGIEAHMGTNCVAPLLLIQELVPQLEAAVRSSPKDSVRVIWTSSVQIEMCSPPGGVDFERIEKPPTVTWVDYAASKAGNWFLALEGAKLWGKNGIISVSANPGNLYTPMHDNGNWLFVLFLRAFVLYESKYGGYTYLFAGFSPTVNESNNGAYIWPWGRINTSFSGRPDVLKAASDGKAKDFWEWCERKWKEHV